MTTANDGGPAFPVPPDQSETDGVTMQWRQAYPGMSLRDYFIANAPKVAWSWFKPKMINERPKPIGPTDWSGYASNHQEISNWDDEYDKQRDIQWPAFWADTMIKARDNV